MTGPTKLVSHPMLFVISIAHVSPSYGGWYMRSIRRVYLVAPFPDPV